MAQEKIAPALSPAGSSRPAGVPADYVITPFGFFHPSCVLQVKKGESLQKGGVLRHPDGSTEQIPSCEHPHYKQSGELVPGSSDAHNTAVVHELDTTPPPAVNGWVENSNVSIGTAYGEVVSTWTVPSLPLAHDAQTVYFFPGLETTLDNPTDILQPVLGSTNGGAWSFVSWDCCPGNTAVSSSGITVNPGDTLIGTIAMTCTAGTTNCSTWNVISQDQTTNQSTELAGTPSESEIFNWGFGGVLEGYGVVQCTDYPPGGSLTISTSLYDSNLNLVPSPNWEVAGASSSTVPQCDYAVNATGTNTTLAYGTTVPSFYLTSAAGSGISVNQGGSATQTFNVTGVNGFSGPVSFTAQNLPTGVSAQFAEGSSSNTYTLTLSATNAASLTGSNPPSALTIVGSAPGVASENYSLNVYVNPPLTGGSGSSVDLASAYDAYGFYDDADQANITPANSLDNGGYVYSANLLSPPGTTPMGLNVNGAQFAFGPPNKLDSVYGNGGSPIDLPSGQFASLNLLATGVEGAQESQTVAVNYTDSTTQEFTQTFDDWSSGSSCTASNPCAPGESVAVAMPYRDTASGAQDSAFYLFAYSFALNPSKAVRSLTLPDNRNVVVLAATLTGQVSPSYSLSAAPGNVSVKQGASTTSTITVTPVYGFSGSVTLSASGLPSGVTAAFNPATTSSTSVVTFSASSSAPAGGPATITITGISGNLTQTTSIGVTVTTAPAAATPAFSLPGGTYSSAQNVTISDSTPGVSIYYTTDGSMPTTASDLYSGAIGLSTTTTIRAIAIAGGYSSSVVASATYMINTVINTGLDFVPVNPCRIADTRNADGPFGGPELAAKSTREFDIPQSACGIPSTAVAYSLNVTVVPNAELDYLTVWPAGESQPLVSTLNSDGRIKANAAIIPAGTNGGISVYATGATQLILDIDGYFVPAGTTSGLQFYPLTPCRVADTRNADGPLGGPSLTGETSRAFPILSSACGIPSAAQAYSLNVTTVPHVSLDYLTAWPTGESQPLVSTLNASTGAITANAAIVQAGTGGDVSIYVSAAADVVLDVNGYFAPPGAGGLSLYTVTPCRVLDTRNGAGTFDGVLVVAVQASTCAPPATAQAYVLNATVVPSGGLGYLTLWPDGETQPFVSTLNASDGAITSNMAIVPTSNGNIDAFSTNPTNLILDLSSYFASSVSSLARITPGQTLNIGAFKTAAESMADPR